MPSLHVITQVIWLLIVKRCHLQRPDVRLHRLLAAGGVLLRTVGGLVSGHLRGVFEAGGGW